MADDNFRSYRNRDPLTRDEAARIASDGDDPLAELARLIGQNEPHAEGRRSDAYHPAPSRNEVETDRDWVPDASYAEQHGHADDRYVPPPLTSAAHPSYAPEQRRHTEEPSAGGRYFSGPATQFNGFHEETDEETDADYRGAQMPPPRTQDVPAYADAGTDEDYATEGHAGGEDDAADEYYDEPARPRRRSGLIVATAVCSLIFVGTAGAFGYRAMFGGSVLPTLPPIIKASNGPNKIVPGYGDAQANTPGQSDVASAGSAEHLVSREEQPVSVEPPKAVPRVVSTIPIVSGENSPQAGTSAPAASPWPNSSTQTQNSPTQTQTPAWPNPPAPAAASPNSALPTPKAAQTAPQSPTAAPASTDPKRIHTVVIRTDQPGASAAAPNSSQPQQAAPAPASPPPAAARSAPAPKSTTVANAPAAGSNLPLSIIPGAKGEAAAPPVTRTQAPAAPAPVAVASAGPVSGMVAEPSSGSGYAVQVTSQRSEAEAQTAFRELRAKYPNQLGRREPIIRRADLGAKGTYYRALVGPFASMAEAAGVCSDLKAAGGNCLVQRN
jgi:hypothetical protein